MFLKRHVGPVARAVALPFLLVGRFLLGVIGIPLFRAYFFLQRVSGRLLGVAKNRLGFFITNSRLIHVAAVGVAALVIIMNVTAGDVRAETFGRQSILYGLVSADDTQTLETEFAVPAKSAAPTAYVFDPSVGTQNRPDAIGFDSEYATTVTGGAVVPLPGSGLPGETVPRAPVPTRTETESYVVQAGDTLGVIADKFGLDLNTILWANNLTLRSTIRPGQTLTILPVDGVMYTVKKGDTLAKIAKTYGADATKLLAVNKLGDGGTLSVGLSLIVPDGEPPSAPPPVKRPSSITDLFTPPASSGSKVVFAPKPSDTATTSRGSAAGKGTWTWPTDWRVITQYFSWKHTGVDIDGDFTTHSYAAADGTVIYAGWRNGYGMTVEVDHGDGLITRYAHHSKLYVNVGDVVKAGDLLAQTGTTGNSTGTHLHFEVIKNGKFQNPLEYIR